MQTRGLLGLARLLGIAQDFQASVATYDRLIAADPKFTIAWLEKARTYCWANRYCEGLAVYERMQHPSAEDVLETEVASLARFQPTVAHAIGHLVDADLSAQSLRKELERSLPDITDDPSRQLIRHQILDFDARTADLNNARLEGLGKSKKDWRNWQAIPIYQELVDQQPANEEALFDLGQVYSGLKQTHRAMEQYARVSDVALQHREASIALERSAQELNPRLRPNMDYFYQNGRDGLARIERTWYTTSLEIPTGDENEFVRAGFSRAYYVPIDDAPLQGNIFTLSCQRRYCDDHLILFTLLNLEQYEDRIRTRPTYEAGGSWQINDCFRVRLTSFLNNVVENGETMRQDIYRLGMNAGVDVKALRKWDFGANYRAAYYSDENFLNEFFVYNDVSITLPPRQLKWTCTLDTMNFARQTIYPMNDPNIIAGAAHPYFAPAGFAYYETRLEWWHWISRDYFNHANVWYYSLQYGIGWDSEMANYNVFRVLFNYDVRSWLTVGGTANVMLSNVYDATSAMGFIAIRFPCCPR